MNPDTLQIAVLAANEEAREGFLILPKDSQSSAHALVTWAAVQGTSTKALRQKRKSERQNRRDGRKERN